MLRNQYTGEIFKGFPKGGISIQQAKFENLVPSINILLKRLLKSSYNIYNSYNPLKFFIKHPCPPVPLGRIRLKHYSRLFKSLSKNEGSTSFNSYNTGSSNTKSLNEISSSFVSSLGEH